MPPQHSSTRNTCGPCCLACSRSTRPCSVQPCFSMALSRTHTSRVGSARSPFVLLRSCHCRTMRPQHGPPTACETPHHSRGANGAGQRVMVATRASEVDLARLSGMISESMDDGMDVEKRSVLEGLGAVLEVPMGTMKNLVYKRKALLLVTPEEVSSRIQQLADVLEVTRELARQMVVIQPGLLFDTEKQAETLKYGIKAICFELDAPKEEVVDLILKNQSVLHGRELRLSVADMAHLAMLREPKGRIVD